ncbi:MAG: hypothetical protein U9R02_09350 [Thermodesulfobacteriota bacterium]|nr:hypothetical protein [Thermodesulfobacteriota bacterium]
MKQIVITHSFQKNLKKLRRHFTEQDVQNNIKEFVRIGLRKGESKLKTETFGNVTIVIVKLRIRVHQAVGRYLLGIINEREYVPIFIGLKTGFYGKNMSFNASKKVVSMLETAFENVLIDYLEHTEENPRLTRYPI